MGTEFSPVIFYTIGVGFIILLAFLAYIGWRKSKTTEDYMLAGKTVPPWLMAISYASALISTSSIVGFGGTAAKVGLGMFWIVTVNIGIGVVLAYTVFGPKIWGLGSRLGVQTMPELLGMRFKSRAVQGIAGLVNFCFMPLYAGAVLVSVSRLLEAIVGVPFWVALLIYGSIIAIYVIGGGLKGMLYADVVLGFLKFGGMAVLVMILFFKAGGLNAFSALQSLQVPAELANQGIANFTSMPIFASPLWWLLVSTLLFGVGFGLIAQPQLGVRFLTLRSTRDIKIAVGFGAFFVFIANGGGILSGAFSNVVSSNTFQKTAYVMAGGNVDAVIPFAVRNFVPNWFGYILLFILFSAALSTSTAQIHTMATSLGYDVLIRTFKVRASLGLVRTCAVLSLFYVGLVAFFLPHSIIAIATAIFFGIAGSVFLPSIIGALYWRRTTRVAVISSMVVGILAIAVFYFLIHERESASLGICNFIFGKGTLFPDSWLRFMDPTFVAVPLSAITLVLVSLFTRRTNEEVI